MAGYFGLDDLPDRLAVFPISGALLLPRGSLPLNVFEPRYLSLVDDVLKGNRLIGMIQPAESEDVVLKPALVKVGCAGRLTGFRETEDGRYFVTLRGICRFAVTGEAATDAPYRVVDADFAPYIDDLAAAADGDFPRERLLAALQDYLSRHDLSADWKSVLDAPPETLVNALAMLCPFGQAEKQALLEAPSWHDRVETLITLFEMSNLAPPGGLSMN
jgi:uncharacterized protein